MELQPTYEERILDAVAEMDAPKEDGSIILLSSGVKLKTKRVPILRIQAIVNKFKYPDVPKTRDEVKDRIYSNPNDPTYLEMRQQVDIERTLAVIDAVAAMGTELYEKPDAIPALDDNSWIDELEAVGLVVNKESKTARYLAWIKYVAVVDSDDLALVTKQAGLSMGISEERVASALDNSFQDN